MARRGLNLPPTLPPLGLSRDEAADYIGVGATKFDEMVADGRMPRPKRIDGRRVWSRLALDRAFAKLPDCGPPAAGCDDDDSEEASRWGNLAV